MLFLVLWASGFGVAKIGLRYAEPMTLLALRFGLIVLISVATLLVLRPALPRRRVDWLHLAVVGFLIQSVYFGLAYLGMSLGVSAGTAAVLAALQPLLVALASPLVTGERVGWIRRIGLLLGAAGSALVVVADSSFDGRLDAGVIFCLGSALGMAAATLYQKRFAVAAHPVVVNLVHYAVGVATVGPLALALEHTPVVWSGALAVALAWLVGANSLVAVSLLLFMIARSEASRVSSLFFLVPPVAALFGWLLLGERMSLGSGMGVVAAIAGVFLVGRADRSASPRAG